MELSVSEQIKRLVTEGKGGVNASKSGPDITADVFQMLGFEREMAVRIWRDCLCTNPGKMLRPETAESRSNFYMNALAILALALAQNKLPKEKLEAALSELVKAGFTDNQLLQLADPRNTILGGKTRAQQLVTMYTTGVSGTRLADLKVMAANKMKILDVLPVVGETYGVVKPAAEIKIPLAATVPQTSIAVVAASKPERKADINFVVEQMRGLLGRGNSENFWYACFPGKEYKAESYIRELKAVGLKLSPENDGMTQGRLTQLLIVLVNAEFTKEKLEYCAKNPPKIREIKTVFLGYLAGTTECAKDADPLGEAMKAIAKSIPAQEL